MLRCLARNGLKLGGKLADAKPVLAERLAHWLNEVVEAGRGRASQALPRTDGEEKDGEPDTSDDELFQGGASKSSNVLLPGASQIGEIPHDARVTPEQAESALGHNQATEFDEDVLEMMDLDQREEEEALTGRHVNPGGVDYSCL